jgi:hypothetical protein
LDDCERAEAGHFADEPEAIEEPIRLHRPVGPVNLMGDRKVLGEGAEVALSRSAAGG